MWYINNVFLKFDSTFKIIIKQILLDLNLNNRDLQYLHGIGLSIS